MVPGPGVDTLLSDLLATGMGCWCWPIFPKKGGGTTKRVTPGKHGALAKSVKVPEFSDSQNLQAAEALQQTKSHVDNIKVALYDQSVYAF